MENLEIDFTHLPSSNNVRFTAFLETFNDDFAAEWASEKVFGRMDPIAQYKGTSRKINCSFTVPAGSREHAYVNHGKISRLLQMMYPNYEFTSLLKVYTITAPPLLKVKFNNLINNSSYVNYGLMGYIPNLKYEPDMNSNIFTITKDNLDIDKLVTYLPNLGFERAENKKDLKEGITKSLPKEGIICFQSFKISFELNVLHTHALGFLSGENFFQANYPHGFV